MGAGVFNPRFRGVGGLEVPSNGGQECPLPNCETGGSPDIVKVHRIFVNVKPPDPSLQVRKKYEENKMGDGIPVVNIKNSNYENVTIDCPC